MQKFSNITLKRGTFTGDIEFFEWMKSISLTEVERRNITVSLLNEEHAPVMIWKIKNAFPIKMQSSDFKSDGNEVAVDTIEIAHEQLTITNGK